MNVKALLSFERSRAAAPMTGRRSQEELDLDEHVRCHTCGLLSCQEEAWWGSYMRVNFGRACLRKT